MHSAPTTRALFFLLFVAPPLFAATEAERHQKNLENLRDRIKAVQNQLIGEVNRKDELTLQLRDTERELGSTAAALRETDINIKYGNLNLEDLREKCSESERKLTGETGALIRQVRSAYIVGRQERVKLLLNQEDPALVGRML
ncbi:MAG: peptidase M23, partial [Gammaproteobacteria bacterium]